MGKIKSNTGLIYLRTTTEIVDPSPRINVDSTANTNFFANDKPKKENKPTSLYKRYVNSNGAHSFLFWLIIPLIITWLTVGYFIGLVKNAPSWSKTGYAINLDENVKPFNRTFAKAAQNNPTGYVTLWLDDAWLSQYMTAYPMMREYNFPGTIAVPVGTIGKTSYANWAQIRILQENSWEVTNHSITHDCDMQNWDQDKIKNELELSTHALWQNYLTSDIFVSPCGVDSPTLRDEVKKDFVAFRTVDPGVNSLSNLDPYNLKIRNIDDATTIEQLRSWLDEARSPDSWMILVFHKVGEKDFDNDSENYNITKEEFSALLSYIDENHIEVVTPSQMLNKNR